MDIKSESPDQPDIIALLTEHLTDMYATSPAECVHALNVQALLASDITFYACRKNEVLMGVAAIKMLDDTTAELKSMRTSSYARNQGVAKQLLAHIITEARHRGVSRLKLETGTMAYFAPARALYASQGFEYCGPFSHYEKNDHSTFMEMILS